MKAKNSRVVAVAYNRCCTFELAIVVELFGLPRPEMESWYELEICSPDPGPLTATGGLAITAPSGLEALRDAGTIVLPGWRSLEEAPPEEFLEALRSAHAEGSRILSICSGAFVLAAAGLLDGKRATTHWLYAERLARRFSEVRVDPNVLYVDEGSILTSAGSAAGIDLGLHVIRLDHGAGIANKVARRLVVPPHRDGGQAQFVRAPIPDDGDSLVPWLDDLRERLDEPHTIASLAAEVGMSPRTLARRFQESVGISPHRWLTRERVFLAQEILETTDLDIDAVAEATGFGSAQLLRLHFRRQTGTPPTVYRKRFRAGVLSEVG